MFSKNEDLIGFTTYVIASNVSNWITKLKLKPELYANTAETANTRT